MNTSTDSVPKENMMKEVLLVIFVILSICLGLTQYLYYKINYKNDEEIYLIRDVHNLKSQIYPFIPNIISNNNTKTNNLGGIVMIEAINDNVHIFGEVKGLQPGSIHAMHILEYSDVINWKDKKKIKKEDELSSDYFRHYNPLRVKHSCPVIDNEIFYHVGDLGNIIANNKGIASFSIQKKASIKSLNGRLLVVNKNKDNCEEKLEFDKIEDILALGTFAVFKPGPPGNLKLDKEDYFMREINTFNKNEYEKNNKMRNLEEVKKNGLKLKSGNKSESQDNKQNLNATKSDNIIDPISNSNSNNKSNSEIKLETPVFISQPPPQSIPTTPLVDNLVQIVESSSNNNNNNNRLKGPPGSKSSSDSNSIFNNFMPSVSGDPSSNNIQQLDQSQSLQLSPNSASNDSKFESPIIVHKDKNSAKNNPTNFRILSTNSNSNSNNEGGFNFVKQIPSLEKQKRIQEAKNDQIKEEKEEAEKEQYEQKQFLSRIETERQEKERFMQEQKERSKVLQKIGDERKEREKISIEKMNLDKEQERINLEKEKAIVLKQKKKIEKEKQNIDLQNAKEKIEEEKQFNHDINDFMEKTKEEEQQKKKSLLVKKKSIFKEKIDNEKSTAKKEKDILNENDENNDEIKPRGDEDDEDILRNIKTIKSDKNKDKNNINPLNMNVPGSIPGGVDINPLKNILTNFKGNIEANNNNEDKDKDLEDGIGLFPPRIKKTKKDSNKSDKSDKSTNISSVEVKTLTNKKKLKTSEFPDDIDEFPVLTQLPEAETNTENKQSLKKSTDKGDRKMGTNTNLESDANNPENADIILTPAISKEIKPAIKLFTPVGTELDINKESKDSDKDKKSDKINKKKNKIKEIIDIDSENENPENDLKELKKNNKENKSKKTSNKPDSEKEINDMMSDDFEQVVDLNDPFNGNENKFLDSNAAPVIFDKKNSKNKAKKEKKTNDKDVNKDSSEEKTSKADKKDKYHKPIVTNLNLPNLPSIDNLSNQGFSFKNINIDPTILETILPADKLNKLKGNSSSNKNNNSKPLIKQSKSFDKIKAKPKKKKNMDIIDNIEDISEIIKNNTLSAIEKFNPHKITNKDKNTENINTTNKTSTTSSNSNSSKPKPENTKPENIFNMFKFRQNNFVDKLISKIGKGKLDTNADFETNTKNLISNINNLDSNNDTNTNSEASNHKTRNEKDNNDKTDVLDPFSLDDVDDDDSRSSNMNKYEHSKEKVENNKKNSNTNNSGSNVNKDNESDSMIDEMVNDDLNDDLPGLSSLKEDNTNDTKNKIDRSKLPKISGNLLIQQSLAKVNNKVPNNNNKANLDINKKSLMERFGIKDIKDIKSVTKATDKTNSDNDVTTGTTSKTNINRSESANKMMNIINSPSLMINNLRKTDNTKLFLNDFKENIDKIDAITRK